MIGWTTSTGDGEHRAYWGADLIPYGTGGTAGRYYMGPLPATGQWVRLEVPASSVGLEGTTLAGMDICCTVDAPLGITQVKQIPRYRPHRVTPFGWKMSSLTDRMAFLAVEIHGTG